ncbi:MAG: YbaB/EbfC family nucleoid-associated protein [Acidimicrobiia bacterium]
MVTLTLARIYVRFSQLLQLGQQMQGRITQMQTELTQRTVTGTSGGGMVTVTADGKGQVRSVKIDKSIVEDGDVEMIEDLVTAAVSDAQRRAEEMYRDELRKVTGGLQLPFQLPL